MGHAKVRANQSVKDHDVSHALSHDVLISLCAKSFIQTIVGHTSRSTRSSTQGAALVHNLGRTNSRRGYHSRPEARQLRMASRRGVRDETTGPVYDLALEGELKTAGPSTETLIRRQGTPAPLASRGARLSVLASSTRRPVAEKFRRAPRRPRQGRRGVVAGRGVGLRCPCREDRWPCALWNPEAYSRRTTWWGSGVGVWTLGVVRRV